MVVRLLHSVNAQSDSVTSEETVYNGIFGTGKQMKGQNAEKVRTKGGE
jgi:hypothetical protein